MINIDNPIYVTLLIKIVYKPKYKLPTLKFICKKNSYNKFNKLINHLSFIILLDFRILQSTKSVLISVIRA